MFMRAKKLHLHDKFFILRISTAVILRKCHLAMCMPLECREIYPLLVILLLLLLDLHRF